MKRLGLIFGLWAALCVPALAQFNGGGFGQPGFTSPKSAVVGFQGIGDLTLTGTVVASGGFSCYKASAPTAKALNLVNETTTGTGDINCNTTTGIDLTAVAALGCGTAVCKVVTIYDQTGNTNCGGAACNISQAVDGNRPTYTASGGAGGKPCATWASNGNLQSAPLTASLTTFSLATVSNRTGNLTSFGGNLIFSTSLVGNYYSSTADNYTLFAGSFSTNVAATSAAFHALAGVLNGASSIIGVDGSPTTPASSPGTNASGTNDISMGDTSNSWIGNGCEFVVVNGAWSTSDISAVSANQHTRYGF